MKQKKLINLLTDNFTVKVICVVIAVFLYGMHRASLLERRTFTVPLSVKADGTMYPMSDWPDYVKVSIRSSTENIEKALQSDIKALLDLTTYEKEGSHSVPISLHLSEKLLLMHPFEVSVKPEVVSVRMEEKTLKYVQVEPSLQGEVKHGYEITSMMVTPSSVKVMGPRSTLNVGAKIFTSEIDVTDLTQTKEFNATLTNINSHLAVSDDTKDFHVRVVVEEKAMTKNFSDVKIVPYFLQNDLKLEKEIPTISFDVVGTVPTLENYELDEKSIFIDFSLIKEPGVYEFPIRFSIPNYFEIKNKSIETVILNIQKVEDEIKESEEVD
ncbi:MAG: hypothetical protein IKI31_04160 [Treponema sp.]|nr:hypothetical protein [Treponema sp.]